MEPQLEIEGGTPSVRQENQVKEAETKSGKKHVVRGADEAVPICFLSLWYPVEQRRMARQRRVMRTDEYSSRVADPWAEPPLVSKTERAITQAVRSASREFVRVGSSVSSPRHFELPLPLMRSTTPLCYFSPLVFVQSP